MPLCMGAAVLIRTSTNVTITQSNGSVIHWNPWFSPLQHYIPFESLSIPVFPAFLPIGFSFGRPMTGGYCRLRHEQDRICRR